MNYNLLEENWMPVLWKDGRISRVGIVDALTQASRIRQIAASNPMDRVAVLRFLLALLYWCRGNPTEKTQGDLFPQDWFERLLENKECFNLLGEGKRFYQCQTGKDVKLSANYLIHEIPTGINFWHFRHATEGKDGLCSTCCAMGLLRLPIFATSGGRGKPPGINSKPPVYVIPLGTTLAETLLLSWRKVPDQDFGLPAWEKPDLELPKRGAVPLLTGLTWLPRRVWLDYPDEIEGNCISCGRKEHLIRKCVFAGIGSTKIQGEGKGQGRGWEDPHIISDEKDIIRAGNALGASDAAAGQWAKIIKGVLGEQKIDETKRLWVVSFATVQNDKYLEAMEYEIALPDTQDIKKAEEKVELWQKEYWDIVRRMRSDSSPRRQVEIRPIVNAIRSHVEGKVSSRSAELLAGNDDAWEQAAGEYAPMLQAVAGSLSPGFTTAASQRRRQIASTKPEMRPGTRKHGRRKGGNK